MTNLDYHSDEFKDFIQEMKNRVADPLFMEKIEGLSERPLNRNQCLYVFDFGEGKVTYARNFELLGYNDEMIAMASILDYHPDDEVIMTAVTQAAIRFGAEHDVNQENCTFCLTYRLKKSDGSYLKVLRQSRVFDLDSNGRMYSNLSILTDISFIKTPGYVNWTFDMEGIDPELFVESVCKAVHEIFTKKERELIPFIITGATSKEIADKHFISKNTVDTHRRSIIRKSGCENTIELLEFAIRNKMV